MPTSRHPPQSDESPSTGVVIMKPQNYYCNYYNYYYYLTNAVTLVRERTIPTERPPLVGEVSANFYG
jgi:hypothetical protein